MIATVDDWPGTQTCPCPYCGSGITTTVIVFRSAARTATSAVETFRRAVRKLTCPRWLEDRWAQAWARVEPVPPPLTVRAPGRPWPRALLAWARQVVRLRKGGRQS